MAHDVFISYSQEDRSVAQTLCEGLESNGLSCWIAPRNIEPGMKWHAAIIRAIRDCRAMVFVFSSHSNESPHVMRELECAVSSGAQILPFRIEEVEPSESIEFFVRVSQWLDAFPVPGEEHYRRASDVLRRQLGEERPQRRPRPAMGTGRARADAAAPATSPQPARRLPKIDPDNSYVRALQQAQGLLKEERWADCVRDCAGLLEKAMRESLQDLLAGETDEGTKQRIGAAQSQVSPGASSLTQLTLRQLLGLYEEGDVFGALRRHLTSNLQKIRNIDWEQVLEWAEAAKEAGESELLDHYAAMHMSYWTKVFVYDCELAGQKQSVKPVPLNERDVSQCPLCDASVDGDWRFCPGCGTALKVTCQACHRVLAPDFKICPYCESRVPRRGAGANAHEQQARDMFRILCQGAYLDGVVNVRERALLDQKRLELGLSTAEAEEIENACAPENVVAYKRLLEGVLVDGVVDEMERAFLDAKADELDLDTWLARRLEEAALGGE